MSLTEQSNRDKMETCDGHLYVRICAFLTQKREMQLVATWRQDAPGQRQRQSGTRKLARRYVKQPTSGTLNKVLLPVLTDG